MTDADVLVIGGGLIGAVLLQRLREQERGARILVVDAGPAIGPVPGEHLHGVRDPELHRVYNARVGLGNQALYVGAASSPPLPQGVTRAAGGIYELTAFGEEAASFPGGAVAWNAGGMGVHWTAATPTPTGAEIPSFLPRAEWDSDVETARRLLLVDDDPYGPDPLRTAVTAALDIEFPVTADTDRPVQPMPMAVTATASGVLLRSGPSRVFPASVDGSDPLVERRAETLCVRLLHEAGRVTGAVLRHVPSGDETLVTADRVVVACDAVRTPQLLWASGIRPAALGGNLNEHAFLTGRLRVDLDRLGLSVDDLTPRREGEWCIGSYWIPRSGDHQPYQGQIMAAPIFDEATGVVEGCTVSLSWYVPLAGSPANRIDFSDDATDAAGLPRATVHFERTPADRAAIARGRAAQARAGRALGDYDPVAHSVLLEPGASLHYTGTTRIGPAGDDTSVCDEDARVRSFDNLWLAGNGVVPTALTANSTLTAAALAVRTARAVARAR
ncbi:GMC oxidoreductase [Frondihabitans cladoniiphilus]|uniref:GMC family oxidoreductase n=1 Tax=Frondihabitans cladoniiphilus TaxID=715785 RepID=A0ABP8VI04_9MICO